MDPDANLKEQRRIVTRCINGEPWDAERLVDLVEALDNWIKKGGALPHDWAVARHTFPRPK